MIAFIILAIVAFLVIGLARAYVAGELELEGDLYALLEGVADVALNGIPRAEQLRLARTPAEPRAGPRPG